ncbi:hypothetical protein D9M72_578470 [compost metagenome]
MLEFARVGLKVSMSISRHKQGAAMLGTNMQLGDRACNVCNEMKSCVVLNELPHFCGNAQVRLHTMEFHPGLGAPMFSVVSVNK